MSYFQAHEGRYFVVESIQRGLAVLNAIPVRCAVGAEGELASCVSDVLAWSYAVMKKNGNVKVESNGTNWTRFVDISLGEYSKADIGERYGTWDDFAGDVAGLLASGYRVGVSFNEGNHSYIVSVTCRAIGDANEGCTFTSFAGDWLTALQVACFKHFVVTKGVWPSPVSPGSAGGIG